MLADLTAFQKQNVFQTGVMSLITGMMVQSSELADLKSMFIKCDTSQDGFLSLTELRNGMNEILGSFKAQATDWAELSEQLDTNGDGQIDYGEFISAAANRARLINERSLAAAFKLFDLDKNGVISISELKQVLAGSSGSSGAGDESILLQIMEEVDKNQDNEISPTEFNAAMAAVVEQRATLLHVGSQVSVTTQ